MQIEEKNGNLILTKVKDFNIEQILECGQCFHFVKLKDMEYVTVAYDKALHIKQESDTVILYDTDMNDYNSVWKKYFDMDTDYGKIKKYLKDNCKELTDAIREKSGIRILRQDFTETLLSFIISQNKQIPHIKQIVAGISKEYGRLAGVVEGQEFYSFPKLEELLRITEDDFRSLKTGFRAPYLCDAISHLKEWGEMESFADLPYEEAKNKLMTIKGVGDKVANCVLLFGLGYTSAFPVDVWIKRIMESIYFKEDTSKDKIMDYAKERFGEYGGYAQQYLFYFARDGKIS
ncbi:MAG: DNA glycosylase [Lachnospiraceae bacterium]|nr:DNA glycosylase [Lachnospiraceae bacterium]